MTEWWYAVEGKQFGPVAEADLLILFQQRRINQNTLVWTHGQSQWQRLTDVPQLATHIIQPPPLPVAITPAPSQALNPPSEVHGRDEHPRTNTPSERAQPATSSEQSSEVVPSNHAQISMAWRRYLAKNVDLILAVCLVVLAQIALAFVSPPFQVWLQNPNNAIPMTIAAFVVSPFVEALLAAMFGASPGKALMGLSVRNVNGTKLDLGEQTIRNIRVAWFGLGAFIPLITVFTMALQYRNVKQHGFAAYDIGRYRVSGIPIHPVRYIAATGIIVATLVGGSLLDIEGKNDARKFAQGQQWINPITLARVDVPSGWVVSSQKNTQGQTIHIFTRPTEELQVVFGQESVSANVTFGSYVQGFVRAVQKDMRLGLPGQPESIGLHDAWTVRGSMVEDATSMISVTFLPYEERVWRTVGVRLRGADPETDAYIALKAKLLLSSVGAPSNSKIQAQDDQKKIDLAVNNFQHELTTCFAYYSIVQNCITNRGDEASLRAAKGVEPSKDKLLQWSFSMGKRIGMTNDAMLSRQAMEVQSMMKTINNTCTNVSSLLARHGERCKLIVEKPEEALDQWLSR